MSSHLQIILNKLEVHNPSHTAKLIKSLNTLGEDHALNANLFFNKYLAYLEKENKTIDFGIDCYLHMIGDMLEQRLEFTRSGKYSNSSFAEVEKKVYKNPEVMTYHMHGLVLAQFLWIDQFERFSFFSRNLKKYTSNASKYLEIGGGHGLYINEALNLLTEIKQFDLVDISQSSLNLARGIIDSTKINYILKNIFDFTDEHTYDFITIGEVLEHLEDPKALLQKTARLLGVNGVSYITTPINAPMIDHIYLFNNADEIRQLVSESGMEIIEEKIAVSDNESAAKAQKHSLPVMYAAFIKPKK